MAELQMRESETGEEHMPDVCMACGGPAETHIRRRFSWYPSWVVLTVFIAAPLAVILMVALTKRMTVHVPVCRRHRGYWWKRNLVMFLPLVVLGVIGLAAIALANNQPGQDRIAGSACVGSFALWFVWLLAAAVYQTTMIRPKEITDYSITLKNVHADFVDAYSEIRRKHKKGFDRSFEDGVEDYDDKLRRRRDRWADRRTGYGGDSERDE